jgi:hypothetical protein
MYISTRRRRAAASLAAALLALPIVPAFAAPAGPAFAGGNGGHFHTRPLDPTAGGGAVAEQQALQR